MRACLGWRRRSSSSSALHSTGSSAVSSRASTTASARAATSGRYATPPKQTKPSTAHRGQDLALAAVAGQRALVVEVAVLAVVVEVHLHRVHQLVLDAQPEAEGDDRQAQAAGHDAHLFVQRVQGRDQVTRAGHRRLDVALADLHDLELPRPDELEALAVDLVQGDLPGHGQVGQLFDTLPQLVGGGQLLDALHAGEGAVTVEDDAVEGGLERHGSACRVAGLPAARRSCDPTSRGGGPGPSEVALCEGARQGERAALAVRNT